MPSSTLRLLPLDLQYEPAIQQMAADASIAATTRIPHPYPAGAARLFIETGIAEKEAGTAYHQVIVEGNTFVGVIGLMHIEQHKQAELGYWIGKPYWGKGYATLAVKHILPTVFNTLQLEKVYASVLDFNKASMQVLTKNGFLFSKETIEFDTRWQKHVNLHVFELMHTQWQMYNSQTHLS